MERREARDGRLTASTLSRRDSHWRTQAASALAAPDSELDLATALEEE
jgi:hypothetical protein